MIKRFSIAALLGITLLTVTAAPPEKQKRRTKEFMRPAIEAQERHRDNLFEHPGVRGSAVGFRKGDGKSVIKIYADRLNVDNIPKTIDGLPVQIEYVGPIMANKVSNHSSGPSLSKNKHQAKLQVSAAVLNPDTASDKATYLPQSGSWQSPRTRFERPVPIGVSAGHVDVTAGTIGCRVSQGCHTYALSNNHVFADSNDAAIGDYITQPGPIDGGSSPNDILGQLYDFVPISYTQSCNIFTCNQMDAALASVEDNMLDIASPVAGGYGAPRTETLEPYVGMKVMKYGRTTALTYGYIDSINATIDVNFGSTNYPKYARFIYQIVIKAADDASYTEFSAGGDSGALIVAADSNYPQPACVNDPVPCAGDYPPIADERKPVALLFASGGTVTIGNKINPILEQFDVLIDGN